ncbi:Hypothetical protein CINCED_3A015605 [Cinara cedri]|uniref:Uncharacterized protein n=1 Tax=Cinara cedri TaxID=506608 RepID=A0A5E4M2K0_9HEMI|nr:Hypothetical protein CINCED_3A015605 [Cinara cedri]
MSSLNIITNEDIFQFRTILEYSINDVYANRQNEQGQTFSINKVFISNGDQFNSKYIIKHFKKMKITDNIIGRSSSMSDPDNKHLDKIKNTYDTSELQKILEVTKDESILTENINIMSSIGLLSKKEYKEFLDQSSNASKLNYLKNKCNQFAMSFKPHLMPLERPKIKHKKVNQNDISFQVMTNLFDEKSKETQHLVNCKIISKYEILPKLMQNSITIFDITNDSESELQNARISFNYIYNELIKYSNEQILRCKKKGIIRKFILISTEMTWLKEVRNDYEINKTEDEEVNVGITHEGVLDRLPIVKYQPIFEFEKLVLKSNTSKIKDIFKTYIISTGIIYGREENALRHVFTNAWNNPKEMYTRMLNRTVPVFHIDELAKLVFIVSMHGSRIKDNYIFANEQESYGFNNILKSMCDELCSSRLVSKEDHLILNQYKFNSFTWDLICCDLMIDPMLDIIVPDYQTQRTSIISNMKKITREFIEANNLYSLKLIVSGQPAYAVANIIERLAQYYKIQVINIPNLVNNYMTSLKNDQNELETKINNIYENRADIIHTLQQLAEQTEKLWLDHVDEKLKVDNLYSVEQIDNNLEHDQNPNVEINNKQPENNNVEEEGLEYLENNNNFQNPYEIYIKHNNDLLIQTDKEINSIKSMIKNLNAKFQEYEKNISINYGKLDDCYLWPIIKETLSSFTCRNQGYILNMFPLSVEQIEFIFNKDIGYPDFIFLLAITENLSIPQLTKNTTSSTITNRNSKYSNTYDPKSNSIKNSSSLKMYQSVEGYEESVDFKDHLKYETNIYDSFDTILNDKHTYKVTEIYDLINYFRDKGTNILSLNLPLEEVDETGTHNLQFQVFTNTIITRIGRVPFNNDILDSMINERRISETNKIDKKKSMRNEKLKKVINKLRKMKEQWNSDILKAQEIEKNQEKRKSNKINNLLSTDILPKLLMEITPSGKAGDSISQFPDKTLNKNKLCRTEINEL